MLRLLSRPLLQTATNGLKKQVGGLASRAAFSTTLNPLDSTFQHQDSLPRLPIPDLTATLEKYKEQIAPLLSTAEFEETAAYIEAFKGQSGKRLHKLLEELDEQSSTSWVEGFWDTMYLELRDPLPVNVSPFFVISDPPAGYKNPANAQVERAAALVHSLFRFQQQVRRKTLTPDMEGQGAKAKPLCMFQYSRLLGTTRIPKYARDELHTSVHSKHIVVMRKDRIFRLDVLDDGALGQEALLSPAQIEERLLKIIDQADAVKDYPNIGTLTTENRNTWGNLYASITAGETINDSSMDDINGALLVVCLDDVSHENANHLGRIFLHSDNRALNANRWYDKLQLIVLPNGTAGVNMEHSPIDGHTLLRLMNDVHHDSTGIRPIVETPSLAASAALLQKSPKLLEWNIGSDVQAGIETAAKNYQGLIDSTESIALDFKDWGKETIKALKFSPDAFVQMAYQLAYYRQYGKVVSTYES